MMRIDFNSKRYTQMDGFYCAHALERASEFPIGTPRVIVPPRAPPTPPPIPEARVVDADRVDSRGRRYRAPEEPLSIWVRVACAVGRPIDWLVQGCQRAHRFLFHRHDLSPNTLYPPLRPNEMRIPEHPPYSTYYGFQLHFDVYYIVKPQRFPECIVPMLGDGYLRHMRQCRTPHPVESVSVRASAYVSYLQAERCAREIAHAAHFPFHDTGRPIRWTEKAFLFLERKTHKIFHPLWRWIYGY